MISNMEGPGNCSLFILKPLGRPLGLTAGETLEAQVTDTFPPDGVSLRLNDTFIPARTSLPIEKGATVQLKVIGLDEKTGQVTLQLVGGPEGRPSAPAQISQTSGGGRPRAIQSLLNELSEFLDQSSSRDGTGIDTRERYQAGTLVTTRVPHSDDTEGLRKVITALIRSLPSDTASLPPDIKTRLQETLLRSLSATDQSIRSRMEALIRALPPEMRTDSLTGAMLLEPTSASDAPQGSELRHALEDTGVLLEAKLKAIAERAPNLDRVRDQTEGEAGAEQGGPRLGSGQTVTTDDSQSKAPSELEGDLKAHLLRLRQSLNEGEHVPPVKTVLRSLTTFLEVESADSGGPHHGTLRLIDGILRDIETYQLLSKATESFQTFLPILWDDLRDGKICFRKKQRGNSKGVYSCRLTLDLERLGSLSVMIVMQNDAFTVSFKPEKPELRQALTCHIGHLGEAFLKKGLSLTSAGVADSDNPSFAEMDAAWSFDSGLSMRV